MDFLEAEIALAEANKEAAIEQAHRNLYIGQIAAFKAALYIYKGTHPEGANTNPPGACL